MYLTHGRHQFLRTGIDPISSPLKLHNSQLERDRTHLHRAALKIQKRWRGYLARSAYGQLKEESTWPIKAFFDYTATAAGRVRCNVSFWPNRAFDDYTFFSK